MGLLDFFGLQSKALAAESIEEKKLKPSHWPAGTIAQLVGGNAISSAFDPGFGVERSLMELLKRSPNGKPLDHYKSLTGSRGIDTPGRRVSFDKTYLRELALSFQFVVSYYNQTVEGFHLFMWNGVRMNGLPIVSGFTDARTEEDARQMWMDEAYLAYGLTSKPDLTVSSGNSGWISLETGLKLIPSRDSKVIWEVSVDQPDFPKPNAPNEGSVLLILAHPGYDTGRKPLAYFGAPQVVPIEDMQGQFEERKRVAAISEAIHRACALAGIEPSAIGSLTTDCGRHTPQAAQHLGEMGEVLSDLTPQLDFTRERVDLVAVLGPLGANTVNYSLLISAYAVHERNHPLLYLSTADPDAIRAMLVFPPPGHTPPDPNRTFREHPRRGQWYAPWWGQRLDGRKDY